MRVNSDINIRKKIFMRKDVILVVLSLTLSLSVLLIGSRQIVPSANALAMCVIENMPSKTSSPVPVILIHGYNEPPSVWSHWEERLKDSGIPFCTVSFSGLQERYDQCGSASDHAKDLDQIVQKVKRWTQHDLVNIVGHSKGGLDARVYLDKNPTSDVGKLIMIGTPNMGDPIADWLNAFDPCTPAANDLQTGANDTMAKENIHTKYYTIAGIWAPPAPFTIPLYLRLNPFLIWNFFDSTWIPHFSSNSLPQNCPQQESLEFEIRGYTFLTVMGFGKNDGIVPQQSAISLPPSTNIGHTSDCHTNLLSEESFQIAEPYILGIRK